jgi:hypothetical protein
VDSPQSRLSKRTTWKPRPAIARQNSSSQKIICAPRPMISNSAGCLRSPNVSYSMQIPFAVKFAMSRSYP